MHIITSVRHLHEFALQYPWLQRNLERKSKPLWLKVQKLPKYSLFDWSCYLLICLSLWCHIQLLVIERPPMSRSPDAATHRPLMEYLSHLVLPSQLQFTIPPFPFHTARIHCLSQSFIFHLPQVFNVFFRPYLPRRLLRHCHHTLSLLHLFVQVTPHALQC